MSNLRLPPDQSLARAWPVIEEGLDRVGAGLPRVATLQLPGTRAAPSEHRTVAEHLAAQAVGEARTVYCFNPNGFINKARRLDPLGEWRAVRTESCTWVVERVA